MKLRKTLQIILLTTGTIALAACSTTGTGSHAGVSDLNGSYSPNPAAENGVSTSGIGGDSGFGGSGNSMVPGADQKYYFDFDQSTVHQSDMPSIMTQAHYLATHQSAAVRIEGNTDARGSREYNIALGERRADAVANVLELQGVNKGQVNVISYGAEKPVALGTDENSYAQNRRDDLIYEAH